MATPFHLDVVNCANCNKQHVRKDGYPSLSLDGQDMVSLCCPGCRDKHRRKEHYVRPANVKVTG